MGTLHDKWGGVEDKREWSREYQKVEGDMDGQGIKIRVSSERGSSFINEERDTLYPAATSISASGSAYAFPSQPVSSPSLSLSFFLSLSLSRSAVSL